MDFLIRDNPTDVSGKVEKALEGGIPIVTSEQFIRILIRMMEKKNSEKVASAQSNTIE